MYGKNRQLFRKNKADIDFERVNYDFVRLCETTEDDTFNERILLEIHNSYELKIRPEKQIAGALGLSRSQVQKMMRQGDIVLQHVSPQFLSVYVYDTVNIKY